MRPSVVAVCTLTMLVVGNGNHRTIANPAQNYVVPTVQVPDSGAAQTYVTPNSAEPRNYVVPTVPLEQPANAPFEVNSANFEANQSPVEPSDNANLSDHQLGEIQPIQPAAPKPDFQVLFRSSVFTASDVGNPVLFGDRIPAFANQILLLGTPKIGPQTRLITTAGGAIVVGGVENYGLINLGIGIRQQIASGTYAQLSYSYEHLYPSDNAFLNALTDNSIRLNLVRQDQLSEKLRLNSGYEVRVSLADPEEQSKVSNSLGVSLSYRFTPKFEGALDYRLVIDNLTNPPAGVDSTQIRQQISTIFTYRLSPNVFLNTSLTYLFGSFLNLNGRRDKLNNFNFGIGLGINLY